jgi:hypothetical protein
MTKATTSNDIPVKTFRITKEKWDEFGEFCESIGSNRTEQLHRLIDWQLKLPGSRPPKRRDVPPAASSA